MTEEEQKDYTDTVEKANKVLKELENKLSTVSVNIPKSSVDVIEAIRSLFGASYIKKDGTSVITFDMFKEVTSKLRDIGKVKVKEYL